MEERIQTYEHAVRVLNARSAEMIEANKVCIAQTKELMKKMDVRATSYREWVMKNCSQPGGKEATQGGLLD